MIYYNAVLLDKTELRNGPLKWLNRQKNNKCYSFFSLTVCPEEEVPLLTRKPLTLSSKMGHDGCNLKQTQKQKSECLDSVHW